MDAAALKKLAVEFLRCANAYTSPILRLSPELVFEIFAHVAELEPTSTANLGWVRLGHVSHAFRLVLLAMRGLWASVVWDVALAARPEVLARAGDMPLVICLKAGRGVDVDAERIEFAMRNITKARRVEIEELKGTTILWTHEPHALSGRSFPHLEELNVKLLHHEGSLRDPEWLGTDVYVLEPVRAPRLRSVHLVNVFIPFCPDSLTSLSLVRTKYRKDGTIAVSSEHLPSPEQFLDILARCVNVRHLVLQNSIPAIAPLTTSLRSGRAIELPSLRSLRLNAALSEVTALWSHLAPLPVEVSITLGPDCADFSRAVGGFVDPGRLSFLPVFSEHFARHSDSRVTALALETDSDDDTFITQCGFFKRASNFVTSNWEGLPIYLGDNGIAGENYVPFLDVWFHQCIWDNHISFSRFIDCIPEPFLARIETLDVMDVFDEDLRRLFVRLPNLHTLHLRSPQSSSLALLVHKSEDSSNMPLQDNGLYLPKLTHLRLLHLEICDDSAAYEDIPGYDEVLDVLTSRRTAGMPILSLHITDLRIRGDWVEGDSELFVARIRDLVPGEVIVH